MSQWSCPSGVLCVSTTYAKSQPHCNSPPGQTSCMHGVLGALGGFMEFNHGCLSQCYCIKYPPCYFGFVFILSIRIQLSSCVQELCFCFHHSLFNSGTFTGVLCFDSALNQALFILLPFWSSNSVEVSKLWDTLLWWGWIVFGKSSQAWELCMDPWGNLERDTCVLELTYKLDTLMSAGLLVLKQKKCIWPRQPQHTGDTEISRQLRTGQVTQ